MKRRRRRRRRRREGSEDSSWGSPPTPRRRCLRRSPGAPDSADLRRPRSVTRNWTITDSGCPSRPHPPLLPPQPSSRPFFCFEGGEEKLFGPFVVSFPLFSSFAGCDPLCLSARPGNNSDRHLESGERERQGRGERRKRRNLQRRERAQKCPRGRYNSPGWGRRGQNERSLLLSPGED